MNNQKTLSIRTIVAIGIGAAVFMVLGRYAAIPTGVPNTELQTAYAFLALMAIIYGPVAGVAIGFIGHALKDFIFYGSPWFSWVIASAVVGLIIGFAKKRIDIEEGKFEKKEMITFNIFQAVANAIAWGVVAPALDFAIYAEPVNKVYAQAAMAGVTNIIITGVLGTILLKGYAKTRVEKGSLDMEDDTLKN